MKVVISAYVRFANALAWHALEVCRGLHATGHEVMLLCQRDSPLASFAASEPFPVNSRLNLNRVDPRDIGAGMSTLRGILRDFRPDILNPHCPPGHSYLAAVRALTGSSAALVRTIAEPRPPRRNVINKLLHERTTDGVILTTESSRHRYEQVFAVDHSHVHTILPGFRAGEFVREVRPQGYRQRLGLREGQVLAGIVARMSPEKGQEVLLEALGMLSPAERRSIHCVIAGNESRERTRTDLLALAKKFGVESHVSFPGPLDDVRPLLAELDLGIITSTRSEAICRIALEYMSFAIPIVTSNVNILPEVVREGVNGWVFSNHDAAELASRLRDILHAPGERSARGKRGSELVQTDFSWKHEVEQIVTVFEAARTRRKAKP